MTTRVGAALVAVAIVFLAAPACGDDDEPSAEPATSASTTTTSSTTTTAPVTGGELDDEQAGAAEAWTTVFDSSAAAQDKAPYLEDAEGVAPTLTAYATTGQQVGGITLEASDVSVEGDTATITYDILFAGTAAYEDQTGIVVREGDGWIIRTQQFCDFMALARTPCS